MSLTRISILLILLTFSGCAVYAGLNYDQLFGKPETRQRLEPYTSAAAAHFQNNVQPIIENRCVVCHACYDAPCQLKMSSPEGIDRGAHKSLVYEGTRLVAANPTRLFEDAESTEQWRNIGFHPVLNERDQTSEANTQAGLMARLLTQKQNHPLPKQAQLEGFDFNVDRVQQCPTIEEYDQYQQDYPKWGMPYGMPGLDDAEHNILMSWIETNGKMNHVKPLSGNQQTLVSKWESFLNQNSLKHQLTARYIYEHLFLSHLYFEDDIDSTGKARFFNLVRSTTPPGQPAKRIATRRPYDDPKTSRVFYRLIPERAVTVDKTHMPYQLSTKKFQDWNTWFIDPDYQVDVLPSYLPAIAANPMTAFYDLPVIARFNFMLDNSQNTIMSFIKGPVCRGQLALNVINDRFWVFFVDPAKANLPEINQFYRQQADNLKLPAERESNTLPVTAWRSYSKQQGRYLAAKTQFTNRWFKDGRYLTTDILWKGDGVNPNAALTVFRHFDSASVVQGLVGQPPKTAWVIDYALLERIHYLLVAGFDVYGNFGHQLITRLYMDFLRLEGESNFLSFLPKEMRHIEHASWYQDQPPQFSEFLLKNVEPFNQQTSEVYSTNDPKSELFDRIKHQLAPVLSDRFEIVNTGLKPENEKILRQFDSINGVGIASVPQIVMILIEAQNGDKQLFTLLHNNAHSNISSLFNEESNRTPEFDDLTLVRGVVGSYPATYWSLHEDDIPKLYLQLKNLKTETDYVKLLDHFAIRRSNQAFWAFSDDVHQWYKQDQPIEFGLLDYNRFENR